MAVVRQKRQFGIQPIGVARIGSGESPIGQAVVQVADNIRRRTFDIAVTEAKKRGGEAAAELDIPSITTIDEGTGTPIAMGIADQMGRYSKEAFENVLLKRFENALSDDIKAKKAELMATLGDSPNAPKLFEKAFTEYLSATGENASGYYKQVIVDYGASALEDGRSRLRVAQIARMRAEAKAAKERQKKEFGDVAFNIGASGEVNFSQFFKNATKTDADFSDYEGIGAAEPGEKATVFDYAQQRFAAGRITYLLQDPDVAKEAGDIYTYFATGRNPAIFNTLSEDSKDAVRIIEGVSTVENPLDGLKVAKNNSSAFQQAEQAGRIFLAEEEAARKLSEAEIQAQIQEQKDYATNLDVQLAAESNNDGFKSIGEYGSAIQIVNADKELNSLLDKRKMDPTNVGSDKYNKIQNHAQKLKEDIGIGIITRTLKGLNSEQAKAFATALGAGNKAVINDFMTPLMFNQFIKRYGTKSYAKYQKIAEDWASGKKSVTDKATATSKLLLKDQKRIVANIINDPDTSIAQKESAYQQFVEDFLGYPNIADDLVSARADLDKSLQKARSDYDNDSYKKESSNLMNNADSTNVASTIIKLGEIGEEKNQDPDTVVNDAQKVLNNVAQQYVTSQSVAFGDDKFSIAQLRLMSEYARTKIATDDLHPNAKKIVDDALSSEHSILGVKIKPDNIALAESISAAATSRENSANKVRIAEQDALFNKNLINGKPIANADSAEVQYKAGQAIAEMVGLPELSSDLFEKSGNELLQEELNALNLIKNNSYVLPNQFAESANRLLNGTMTPENIPNFIRNTREFLFRETANGDVTVSPAAYQALGEKKAAKLEALFIAYSLAPVGGEAAFMQTVAQQIKTPLKKEVFEEVTGYSTPESMLIDIGVPLYAADDLKVLAQTLPILFGSDAADELKKRIEARYTGKNANAYSPFTGGSFVYNDVSMHTDDIEGFEKGVAEIVKTIDPNLRFVIGSKISVDDLRREVGFLNSFIDPSTTVEKTRLRTQDRVFYGPAMDSSIMRPSFQLYKMDEYGNVSLIPNSGFNFNTPEIAIGMDTILPPKTETVPVVFADDPNTPNLNQPSSRTIISESQIESNLSPKEQSNLEAQIKRRETISAPKYSTVPTGPIIMPDQDLMKSVSRIAGSGSQASQIISNFNNLSSPSEMRSEITRVINLTEDLPQTKGRDDLLRRLYEVRKSLHGKGN